jgi:hypothetical protein
VSEFGWRESVWSCSPMMADDGGARAGTREEEGSPVAGAGEAGASVVEKEGSSSSGCGVRWLLQIDKRTRENERGKWGGGGRLGATWRKRSERERGPGCGVR